MIPVAPSPDAPHRARPWRVPRTRALLVAGAALMSVGAAAPAHGTEAAGAWATAVDGLAVRLVAARATFVEGGETGRQADARLDLGLEIANWSRATRTVRLLPYAPFELTWEITAADGTRYQPTFFPPSPPPPGDRTVKVVLKPNEQRRWVSLHGISGFNRVDEPPPDGRWFQVLPAGRYAVRVVGVPIQGLKTPPAPGPVTITVRPADEPVAGLKLAVTADRTVTAFRAAAGTIDPVRLKLALVNVGKRPVRVAPRDLLRRFVTWEVQGSHASTAVPRAAAPPPTAADLHLLQPGERLVLSVAEFPGTLGARRIHASGRGWYQIRAVADRPASTPCPAADCWSGKMSSNLLWIRVR